MKLRLVGIIVYNPSNDDIRNIINLSHRFEKVIVYLNSPLALEQQHMVSSIESIEFLGNQVNDGMSVACDEICKYVKKAGYRYVLMLDQDSRISKECLDALFNRAYSKQLHPDVRMLCPVIDYGNGIHTNGKYSYVSWCITSGSLLDVSDYGVRYNFDLKYFIDRVDADICKQIINAGYRIERVNAAVLQQKLGEEVILLGKRFSEHSPIRHYYISRNRLYYNCKFGISLWISFLQTFKHLFGILTHEHNKGSKILSVIKGIRDYKNKKMGKICQD